MKAPPLHLGMSAKERTQRMLAVSALRRKIMTIPHVVARRPELRAAALASARLSQPTSLSPSARQADSAAVERAAEVQQAMQTALVDMSIEFKDRRDALVSTLESEPRDVPLLKDVDLDHAMVRKEEILEKSGDGVIAKGSLFLGSITTTSSLNGGAPLFTQPLSPGLFQGSRLAAFAQLYDLYRWKKLIFEWIPIAPATQAGALFGSCNPDAATDDAFPSAGDAVIREAASRPGAEANQVFERKAYGVSFSQQAWYFTDNLDEPNLSVSGVFSLVPVSSLPTAVTYGLLVVHYECEMMQASQEHASLFAPLGPTSMSFSLSNEVASASIYGVVPAPISGLTNKTTYIGCAVVVGLNLNGSAATFWNLVYDGTPVSLAIGHRIWFRTTADGAYLLFYGDMAACMRDTNPIGPPQPGTPGALLAASSNNAVAAAPVITFASVQAWQQVPV